MLDCVSLFLGTKGKLFVKLSLQFHKGLVLKSIGGTDLNLVILFSCCFYFYVSAQNHMTVVHLR